MPCILKPNNIFLLVGRVVRGFGRGSKQLGIPTANLDETLIDQLPPSVQNGIYFAWAKLDKHLVTKAVVSIGQNPYFRNTKRSVEAHLLGDVPTDFYGATVRLLFVKYHRPEKDFDNLSRLPLHLPNLIAALIDCIHDDIREAHQHLDSSSEAIEWRNSELLNDSVPIENGS